MALRIGKGRAALALVVALVLLFVMAAPVGAVDKTCSTNYEVRVKSNWLSGTYEFNHWHRVSDYHAYYDYASGYGWNYSDTNLQAVDDAGYGADGTVTGFSVYCVAVPL